VHVLMHVALELAERVIDRSRRIARPLRRRVVVGEFADSRERRTLKEARFVVGVSGGDLLRELDDAWELAAKVDVVPDDDVLDELLCGQRVHAFISARRLLSERGVEHGGNGRRVEPALGARLVERSIAAAAAVYVELFEERRETGALADDI